MIRIYFGACIRHVRHWLIDWYADVWDGLDIFHQWITIDFHDKLSHGNPRVSGGGQVDPDRTGKMSSRKISGKWASAGTLKRLRRTEGARGIVSPNASLTRDEPGTRILYFQTSLGLDRVTNSVPKNNCGLLTNARYLTGRMHFLSPNQQRQSTEELLLYYRTVLLNFNSRFLEGDKDNEHSWGTQCIEGLLLSGVKIGPYALWTPNLCNCNTFLAEGMKNLLL